MSKLFFLADVIKFEKWFIPFDVEINYYYSTNNNTLNKINEAIPNHLVHFFKLKIFVNTDKITNIFGITVFKGCNIIINGIDDMKIDGNKLNNAYEKWTSIIFSKPLFFFHLTLITIAVVSFINIKGIPCF